MRYQRVAKKIPVVLNAQEVTRILEVATCPGLRDKAAFSVAFGGALHVDGVNLAREGSMFPGQYRYGVFATRKREVAE